MGNSECGIFAPKHYPLLSQSSLGNPSQAGELLPAERTIQGPVHVLDYIRSPWALTRTLGREVGGRQTSREVGKG